MTTYFDNSSPGGPGPLTSTGQVYNFGNRTKFWLTAISNVIPGQSIGPSVTFKIWDKEGGFDTFTVDYGQPPTKPCQFEGNIVDLIVPSGNPVSIRCILSSEPQGLGPYAIALGGTAITPEGSSINLTVTGAGNYVLTLSPPPGTKWTLWALAMKVFETSHVAGSNFTISELAIGIVTSQGLFNSEGPYWNVTGLSDTVGNTQSDEFWLVPPGTSGVFSSANFSHFLAQMPVNMVLDSSMAIYIQVTISGISVSPTMTINILPIGLQQLAGQ